MANRYFSIVYGSKNAIYATLLFVGRGYTSQTLDMIDMNMDTIFLFTSFWRAITPL